jgi:hypothetical protein
LIKQARKNLLFEKRASIHQIFQQEADATKKAECNNQLCGMNFFSGLLVVGQGVAASIPAPRRSFEVFSVAFIRRGNCTCGGGFSPAA